MVCPRTLWSFRRIYFAITNPSTYPGWQHPGLRGRKLITTIITITTTIFPAGKRWPRARRPMPCAIQRAISREIYREICREKTKCGRSAALRGDMSRAEAAVRRIAHEWVLACNTKHLDDLLDLYVPDALVLRSNCPPVRGAAAVREFFFGALDAGLGEAEVEPLRVEVVGDLAYEAGRCKALIPGATGKRREERGKYLWVCARQSNGEWKLAADCWSSDLTLSTAGIRCPPRRRGEDHAPAQESVSERRRFWVAQRFQRCDKDRVGREV
jgi:uncharacterized protein (TIGR02246 family)